MSSEGLCFDMKIPLLYQQLVFVWFALGRLFHKEGSTHEAPGMMLLDAPGLGKTISVWALVAAIHQEIAMEGSLPGFRATPMLSAPDNSAHRHCLILADKNIPRGPRPLLWLARHP